jgi:hypothetical protein
LTFDPEEKDRKPILALIMEPAYDLTWILDVLVFSIADDRENLFDSLLEGYGIACVVGQTPVVTTFSRAASLQISIWED